MVLLFLMVFWTFIWAWLVITKVRVKNYFVDMKQEDYRHNLHGLLLTNKKYQVGFILILVSGGVLLWAVLNGSEEFDGRAPMLVEPYMVIPMIEPVDSNVLQVDTL